MNNLENLVKQYETKNPGKKAYYSYRMGQIPDRPNPRFMDWMAELASRPTCGVEQRKFLDEVENRFNVLKYMADDSFAGIGYSMSATKLMKEDLQDIDLQKVLEGE
mgnify:FL=1